MNRGPSSSLSILVVVLRYGINIVVILHNLLGYLLGYLTGVVFKMNIPRKKAISIEIGMQNSGLAATLAASVFPNLAMATVPGAIFSVWHNISGAIIAGVFRRIDRECDKDQRGQQIRNHVFPLFPFRRQFQRSTRYSRLW